MKYYGNGPWLNLLVHGSKVTFRRPKGSDLNACLDAVPTIRSAMIAADALRKAGAGGPSEVALSVPIGEVRAVCTFLASHTLTVEGMEWAQMDEGARCDVWDEQGIMEVMRAWGVVIACHATPAAAEGLNAMLVDVEKMKKDQVTDHAAAEGSCAPLRKAPKTRKRRAAQDTHAT